MRELDEHGCGELVALEHGSECGTVLALAQCRAVTLHIFCCFFICPIFALQEPGSYMLYIMKVSLLSACTKENIVPIYHEVGVGIEGV